MSLSREHIEKINKYFKNKPVLKAYLFGSNAKGKQGVNSDIDILVELDYSQTIGLLFVKMQQELEEILNSKVDLVSAKGISTYISPLIEKDKELIYAK